MFEVRELEEGRALGVEHTLVIMLMPQRNVKNMMPRRISEEKSFLRRSFLALASPLSSASAAACSSSPPPSFSL